MQSVTGARPRSLIDTLGYENVLLAILCVTFGTLFWNRLAFAFVLPFVVEDLKLNNTEAGLLVSILALTWAISGFVVGALADRTGRRKGLLVVLTVTFAAMALLSGLAASFGMLLVLRLLLGAAQGPVLPLAQATIARESTPARRGLNMGLLQNLGSGLLANILAPIAVVAMAVAWGWREALMVSAIPGFLLAAALLLVMRPDPPRAPLPVSSAFPGLAERNVWLCLAATCAMVMWLMVQMTFLPTFMMQTLHFSSSDMALQLSIRGGSGLVAGILLPGLSDRLGRKPVIVLGALCAAISPFWVALPGQTFTTMMLSGLVMGAGAGCMPLVMAIVPSETVPPAAAAATMGLIMGLGELFGGFGAPVAAGYLADQVGASAPFVMAGVAAILASLLGLFLRETAGRRLQEASA